MTHDPRPIIIEHRLADVKRLVAISSGKGGVGKSLIAGTLALALAHAGRHVGLLDLDFAGSSAHLVLGVEKLTPQEEKGIIPPEIHGVRFMSLVHYLGDVPVPLRGEEVTDAIVELLAITRWGALDTLVVDMPPGIGEATLEAIRLLPRAEFLVVSTASRMAVPVVRRVLRLLQELRVPIVGVVENMCRGERSISEAFDVPVVGSLPFDEQVENAIGRADAIMETRFAQAVRHMAVQAGLI